MHRFLLTVEKVASATFSKRLRPAALVTTKSAPLRFRLTAKPPSAPLRLPSPRRPFHLCLRGDPGFCLPAAAKFHTCRVRSVFSHIHAAAENRFYAFRACGHETLGGFFESIRAPRSFSERGALLFFLWTGNVW